MSPSPEIVRLGSPTLVPSGYTSGDEPLEVSKVALGTWALGGSMWGGTDQEQSVKTILTALDQGINLIDTAPVYGFGRSEEFVGHALKEYKDRDHVVIATKAGLDWDPLGRVFRNASRNRIREEVDSSLRRLQTDYIDLYQIHWPDPTTPHEETAQTLNELVQAGKIRAIGVSNYSTSDMAEFSKHTTITTIQPPYNLFERDAEQEVIPYATENHISVLSYSAICRGLLSGKVTEAREYHGDDLRKYDPKFTEPLVHQYIKAVQALEQFAYQHYQKSILEFSLRWVLDQGTIALWGARKPEQLNALSHIWDWHIAPEHMAEIDQIIEHCIESPISSPDYLAPPLREEISAQP